MEELRLLARSVFVLDSNDKVVYKELVSEGTDFPNFDLCIRSISQHLISILDDRYNVKVSIFISKCYFKLALIILRNKPNGHFLMERIKFMSEEQTIMEKLLKH